MFSFIAGPVTIADQEAEEAMIKIILKNFPTHAMSVFIFSSTFFFYLKG